MSGRRSAELVLVVAAVALFAWWAKPAAVKQGHAAATHSQPTPAATPTEVARPEGRFSVGGYLLGQTSELPEVQSASSQSGAPREPLVARWTKDSTGQLDRITGRQLSRDGKELFRVGDDREVVRQALGDPVGFSHGGRHWGYWTRGLDDPKMGILVEFNEQGVAQVSMASDWSVLSTEMMLSTSGDPVDGSDGYEDLRRWAQEETP